MFSLILCHWFNTWYQSKIRIGKPFQQEEIEEVAHDTTRGVKVTTKIVDYFYLFFLSLLSNQWREEGEEEGSTWES